MSAWRLFLAAVALGTLAFIALIMAAYLSTRPALSHDHKGYMQSAQGDNRRNEWFKGLWSNPANTNGVRMSCCNLNDCTQVEAEQDGGGNWYVLVGQSRSRVPVPPAAVLKSPLSIDGEAYVCWRSASAGQSPVRCFVPPIPGY